MLFLLKICGFIALVVGVRGVLEVTCFNSMSNDGWWTTALVVLNVQVGPPVTNSESR